MILPWKRAGWFGLTMLMVGFGDISSAAEFQRSRVLVQKWTIVESPRPGLPAAQNYYRFYVNSASWGSSTCAPDTVDVPISNCHLSRVLLSTLANPYGESGPPYIEVGVDDTLRPIDGTCQVVWAAVYNRLYAPASSGATDGSTCIPTHP